MFHIYFSELYSVSVLITLFFICKLRKNLQRREKFSLKFGVPLSLVL